LSDHKEDISWFWSSDLYYRLQAMRDTKEPNLLKLLFAAHDEVRLHTPVLGWLLDPKGDHGLGKGPLVRFLSMLNLDFAGAGSAQVWRERSFAEYGRVDLMIQLPGSCVVIENKLYAADQEAQLWRYQKVLNAQAGPPATSHLFYLTPDGCEPSPFSISAPADSGDKTALEKDSYRCISYQTEVHAWLEGLLEWASKQTEKRRTHHILQQYYEVLMEVIGMHSREEALAELESSGLQEHLARHQGDVSALARLTRSIHFLHAKLLEELVEAVHEKLGEEPRLEPAESPNRWNDFDWPTYEGWAKGRTPDGYRFYRILNTSDAELQDMYLVVGLDAADRFWVGLGRFEEGEHVSVPNDRNRFADIEGATHNEWWLSWVTIQELNPAQLDGDSGVGRLATPEVKGAVVNKVMTLCRRYLNEIA
tara:strand:- start:6643 stop:7905 length:1263 start_codon:yes stop_codon:yes gene_type:complete